MIKGKYTYKDDFEMLMIRHEYLSKIKNPNPQWFREFEPIVNTTASIMFEKLKPNFIKVGYGLEDVKMITNCYIVGYMGLYSLERNEKAKEKIVQTYLKNYDREPTDQELAKKDRINLISFLRQRLQHASVICARKARNITVGTDKRVAYALTDKSVSATKEMIFENGERLGYRKITKEELKSVKLKAKDTGSKELVDSQGFGVIEIEFLNEGIAEYDYYNIFISEKEDTYHNSPEDIYIMKEKEVDLSLMVKEFNSFSVKQKKNCLRKFISTFKDSNKYKQELKEARKILKTL